MWKLFKEKEMIIQHIPSFIQQILLVILCKGIYLTGYRMNNKY